MVCTSTLPGQPCNVIAHCQGECSQSFEGVSCGQKSAISTRDETEATFVSAALGKCDGVQGKCYDCTDSHQGVLTCEYGFCYVEPKHWCANGWSCHDDCSCCKKDRKRGSENIRSVEAAPKVCTLPNSESIIAAHILESLYGSYRRELSKPALLR
jgi:hypothetical protein